MARFMLLTWALLTWTGCQSIRLLQVSVPSVIQAGESAALLCDVDMEGDRLYSVKWYKDNEEFFRYVPRDSPEPLTYNVEGIFVNRSMSDAQRVLLSEVNLSSSGLFRCEVSAEAPSFSSVSGGGHMEVVVLPRDRPVISGGRSQYRPSDLVDVNCTSAASKPAAKLRWYVNGKKASANYIRQYKSVSSAEGLETTVLGLTFIVHESHLKNNGGLSLRCVASVGPGAFPPFSAAASAPSPSGVLHGFPAQEVAGDQARNEVQASSTVMENMEVLFLASSKGSDSAWRNAWGLVLVCFYLVQLSVRANRL